MSEEVWDDKKFEEYTIEQKEIQRQKMAGNNRYKQYKRFKKNN